MRPPVNIHYLTEDCDEINYAHGLMRILKTSISFNRKLAVMILGKILRQFLWIITIYLPGLHTWMDFKNRILNS